MAAPKRQGLLSGKGTHTGFGEGVRESRSPLCRRARPGSPFAVPEERRVEKRGMPVPEHEVSGEPCKSEVQPDMARTGAQALPWQSRVRYKT